MGYPTKRYYPPRSRPAPRLASVFASPLAGAQRIPPLAGQMFLPGVDLPQRELRLAVRIPPASKLEEANAQALEIVALGVINPAPDAFLSRPENQSFRKELIRLAFQEAEGSTEPLVFRDTVRLLCRGRIHGKGKETRARRISVRAEALLRLIRMLGTEVVRELIAAP